MSRVEIIDSIMGQPTVLWGLQVLCALFSVFGLLFMQLSFTLWR